MKKTQEIKLMIIENFIDYFTSSETERDLMKQNAQIYVAEDHVDEIEQAGFVSAKDFVKSEKVSVDPGFAKHLNIVLDKKIRNLKASSVEQGFVVRFTEEHKNKLVDEELIHFDGFEWKFFDSDCDRVRAVAEY